MADLTNLAYIRHCTQATGSFGEEEVEPTSTRLSVTTCTLVSGYVHLYTHATSIQSYVQGDKHPGLPHTNIHDCLCGGYFSGVQGMLHVPTLSVSL